MHLRHGRKIARTSKAIQIGGHGAVVVMKPLAALFAWDRFMVDRRPIVVLCAVGRHDTIDLAQIRSDRRHVQSGQNDRKENCKTDQDATHGLASNSQEARWQITLFHAAETDLFRPT